MEKPQIGMKHLTEQNGIEFQYPDLQDIDSSKWVFSMQPFISTSITRLPFSFMIKWVRNE